MTMLTSPKFCVFGAGAIGGTIATLLATSGATVSVVARGATLGALKRDGIRLIMNGEMLQAPVQASENASDLGVQDYLIIAVKSPALADVAKRIGPLLGPKTAVVTAMNGVPWWFFLNKRGVLAGQHLKSIDPHGSIRRAISINRVIGCVVHVAAAVDGPGVIRHYSGHRLFVGEPDNEETPRLTDLVGWPCGAGFACQETLEIQRDIWFKLWGNLSLNPISLLTASTSDRIIDDPLVRKLCASMMQEAAQIGVAIGIPPNAAVEKMIETIRTLGPFKTSMLQDVEHGKPVEIDALLTVTREIGLLVGVPTPFIDAVLGLARLRATNLGLFASAA
jgi:2-dehydropantoate 2-reductase